jgi:purine-nucleoside phosphorylase
MDEALTLATFAAATNARPPDAGIILGSGMSALAARCSILHRVPYERVPGLAPTSVAGHAGWLTLGDWVGKRVLFFEGRAHYYEGHSWSSVVQPIHIAHHLGARVLLLTNAAGGIHDALFPGSLMALRDHIEWTRPACWRHPCPGRPSPYSSRLLQQLVQAAKECSSDLLTGVYGAVTGPCYETPAEIRALRIWGADAVGMSTAREVQAGYELGMECGALSCITNRAAGLSSGPINHDEVLATAAAQSHKLANMMEWFLRLL